MRLSLLALALFAAGCAAPSTPAPTPPGVEDDGPPPRAGEGRPATKPITVSTEGETSTETATLAAFPDFPAPFSTYILDGMTVEQPGSGDAVSLEHRVGRILVGVSPRTAAAEAQRLSTVLPGVRPLPVAWAEAAFSFDTGSEMGAVYVVEHGGIVVTIEATSTYDGGDGAGAIESAVFAEWRWADGSPLR